MNYAVVACFWKLVLYAAAVSLLVLCSAVIVDAAYVY